MSVADQRVVIGRLDAAAGQHLLAEVARRAVARIDHQHMVAAFEAGLQRRGDRGEARRHQHRAIAALDGRHRLFEREGGRRAEQTVADDVEARARVALGLPLGHVRRQDRRGVIDWRIDGAVLRLRMTPEMGEERILAIFSAAVAALHKGTLRLGFRDSCDFAETTSISGVKGKMARSGAELACRRCRGCSRCHASEIAGVVCERKERYAGEIGNSGAS